MIDNATVGLIIESADIVDVVSDFVTLRRRGTNYVGLCPFHNDRTPSFYVSKSKGICKCFSCGEGGSAVNFIMKHEQLSYHDALIYLANKYHIEVNERELTDEEKERQTARDAMFMLNEWACKYFEGQLHDTTEGKEVGLAYFNERGFSETTIKNFRLGYSPEDRSALYKAAIAQGFNRKLLFDAGLCVDDNRGGGYDRYRGRVIFPIFNVSGKIVAFGGRTLKKDKTVAKYVNSPESIIYSKRKEIYGLFQAKREIAVKGKCYIVEGYADVISMHQSGFCNVIAASGTALTEEQVHMIHRFTENVTEMFDGDAAGIKAAFKGVDKVLAEGLNAKILLLPTDEDPDSYSRTHSASEVQQFIDENERDFIEFKTTVMLKDCGRDPVKRAQAIESVARSISVIPSEVTRAVYAKECSDLFGIGEGVVLRSIAKYIKQARDERLKKDKRKTSGGNEGANVAGTDVQQPPVGPDYDAPPVPPEIGPEQDNRASQPVVTFDLHPQEEAMIKYIVKYGMCNFCIAFYEGQEMTTQNVTVAEYVSSELNIDNISFTNPDFAHIFEIAMGMLPAFYADMPVFVQQVEQEGNAQCEELVRQIDPIGHTIDSLKQEEDRIRAQVAANNVVKVNEYRMRYLEKRLCSHPDDRVREIAGDLVSERYVLSKIHTEYATIPTEFDRLEILIPGALNNWKNALIDQRIKQVQAELETATGDRVFELLRQQSELFELRKQIAKLIGDRVVNPI
ncbi:MAG: DNA primase [Muribaculaceae bacterium]|nr:DNA primase [Muribaculaceae bacterium]